MTIPRGLGTIAWAAVPEAHTRMIARKKGRSFLGYWAFGLLVFLMAVPWKILMKPGPEKGQTRTADTA